MIAITLHHVTLHHVSSFEDIVSLIRGPNKHENNKNKQTYELNDNEIRILRLFLNKSNDNIFGHRWRSGVWPEYKMDKI